MTDSEGEQVVGHVSCDRGMDETETPPPTIPQGEEAVDIPTVNMPITRSLKTVALSCVTKLHILKW